MKFCTWRRLLTFVLTFDLAFAPLLAHAHDSKEADAEAGQAQSAAQTAAAATNDPALKEMLKAAESFKPAEGKMIDTWSLLNQSVDIIESKDPDALPKYSYALDRAAIDRQRPVFTSLKPYIENKVAGCDNCIGFEATRGMNKKNENGTYVAREYLKDMPNVAAIAPDEELLSIVDNSGRIHVLDMGFVSLQAFTSIVPIERNVWEPKAPMNLAGKKVTARYLTLGSRPFDPENVMEGAVLPMKNGEISIEAGDLLVEVDGKVLGIFNRDVLHARLEVGQSVLLAQAAWLKKDQESIELLAKLFEGEQKKVDAFREQLAKAEKQTVDPAVALAYGSMGHDQHKALMGRIEANAKSISAKRPRDRFTLTQLIKYNEEISASIRRETPDATDEDIAKDWQNGMDHVYANEQSTTVAQDILIQKFGMSEEKAKERTAKAARYTKLAAATAALVGGLTAPILIENSETLQQINVVSWLYSVYPSVLKDAAYREPLIYSTLILTAIWPVSLFLSWSSGKLLNQLSDTRQDGGSWFAQKVRDMANTWGPMETWQRITTFGMRYYAEIVLAPHIQLIERALQQKTLIPSLTHGMNPFKVVKRDSAEGQAANLTRDTMLGFGNPFAADQKERVEKQFSLLSEMNRRRNAKRTYVRLLAGIAVSEHYKIDQATLETLSRLPDFKLSDVEELVTDPAKRREWDITQEALLKQITALPLAVQNGELDLNEDDVIQLAKDLQIAQTTADRLLGMRGAEPLVRENWSAFKRGSAFVVDFLMNQGRAQYAFLKKIVTSTFVFTNVSREFVTDHMYVVLLIALFGDRADLAHPENLAASLTGLLWVAPQHWADVGYNVYAHFFMSGARLALVYQMVKPAVAKYLSPRDAVVNGVKTKDGSALPINDNNGLIARASNGVAKRVRRALNLKQAESPAGLTPNLERESFGAGFVQFAANSTLPWRSDVGTLMKKYVSTQVQTFYAYLAMSLLLRTTLGHQTFGEAGYGLMIAWFLAWFYIKPWWIVVNQSVALSNENFEAKEARYREAQRKLEWGLREVDPTERQKLQRGGVWEMFTLFDESNPGAISAEINPLTSSIPLDEQAAAFLELSRTASPGAMAPNKLIPWMGTTIAAVGSTIFSVPMILASYNVANMNPLAITIYASAFGAMATVVWFLGRKDKAEGWRQAVVGAYESVKGKCEQALSTR